MAALFQIADNTAQAARSRAYGCLFFIGFGTVWMCTGLAAMQLGSAGSYGAVGAVSAGLLAMVMLLLRRAKELPIAAEDGEQELRAKRMFTAVNIIQWVSVATAVTILSLLHMPEYIVPAIAMIVGLHLFPLAGSFRNRQHYVTATLLIMWSLGSLALLPRERVPGVGAFGTGLILLASAAWTLVVYLSADAASGPDKVRV